MTFTSSTPGSYTITPVATASGANGTTPVLTLTTTDAVTVLGHSNPLLSITGGSYQSAIVGSERLGQPDPEQLGHEPLALGREYVVAGLSGSNGTAVVPSGGSTSYTGTLEHQQRRAGPVAIVQPPCGDQQSLPGANPLST